MTLHSVTIVATVESIVRGRGNNFLFVSATGVVIGSRDPFSQIFPPFACSRQIDPLFHVGTPFIHSFPPLPNFPPFLCAYAIFIRFSAFLPRSSTSFPSSQNFPPFSPLTHLVGTCATRGYNYPHEERRCSSRRSGYKLQTHNLGPPFHQRPTKGAFTHDRRDSSGMSPLSNTMLVI